MPVYIRYEPILAVMQVAVEEYIDLWKQYQKEIHYIDE